MKMQTEEEKIKKNKNNKGNCEFEHVKTEWVLCSEDWRDIVIMYVTELNDIPIEDSYAEISKEEIKDIYLKYGK